MSQLGRVKLCTSRRQLDKQHDIWLSCSLEEGHAGQHSAAAYNRRTFWGDAVTEAAQQPRESLSAATPTLELGACEICGANGGECIHTNRVLYLCAKFSDLAVELEKHSNDHIRDELPDSLGAAVEGVCADRINAILKEVTTMKPHGPVSERFMRHHYGASGYVEKASAEKGERVGAAKRQELADRITQYLCVGGFFNPEAMEHDKVRTLLMDCRDFLASAEKVERVGAAKSDELKHHPDYRQFLSGIESHIKDYPNLGECEWNCITAGPLLELVAKVKAECAAAAPAGEQIEGLRARLDEYKWLDELARHHNAFRNCSEDSRIEAYRDDIERRIASLEALLAAGGKG